VVRCRHGSGLRRARRGRDRSARSRDWRRTMIIGIERAFARGDDAGPSRQRIPRRWSNDRNHNRREIREVPIPRNAVRSTERGVPQPWRVPSAPLAVGAIRSRAGAPAGRSSCVEVSSGQQPAPCGFLDDLAPDRPQVEQAAIGRCEPRFAFCANSIDVRKSMTIPPLPLQWGVFWERALPTARSRTA
jgi:hypothetical protein